MQRRSTARTARKRYTVDAFEGIDGLQDATSDVEAVIGADDDDEAQSGFEAETGTEEDDDDEVEDGEVEDDEGEDDEVEDVDVSQVIGSPEIHVDDHNTPEITPAADSPQKRRRPSTAKQLLTKSKFTRAAADGVSYGNKVSKDLRRLHCFTPSLDEYTPIQQASRKWEHEPVLPSRNEDEDGYGGFHRPFVVDDISHQDGDIESWNWYFQRGGLTAFAEQHVTTVLQADIIQQYLYPPEADERCLLVGPVKQPKMFKLRTGESMLLNDAWNTSSEPTTGASPKSNSSRNGYIINVGTRVQSMEWLPNQDTSSQYLAISVLPTRASSHPLFEAPNAPSFTPQPSHAANIQVWKFKADSNAYPDRGTKPTLKLRILTSWGEVRQFKHCPIPLPASLPTDAPKPSLLAGVWGDGGLRVIQLPNISEDDTLESFRVDKAAFESHPPDTVFTCVAWISPTKIAAGCANGCVAIYDIEATLNANVKKIRPEKYAAVTNGYVLSMASCYPSHPHMLLTTSMDGYIRLTDTTQSNISSPAASVVSQRSRFGLGRLAWHDYCLSAITVDEAFAAKALPIRRLFNAYFIGRYNATITSLAVSQCHPFVLAGQANGEVTSSNPTLKVVISPKIKSWQACWFAHEWRRPREEDSSGNNPFSRHIAINGLTRFIEGYKVKPVGNKAGPDAPFAQSIEGVILNTIYEKQSAVTALAWNPNIHVAGWAAAGMADGLVRVEDIALPGYSRRKKTRK